MERRMGTEGRGVRRGGIRVTRSIGNEGGSGGRDSVSEDKANFGTEPTGGNHGTARACRVDGEGGNARLEDLIDKAGEDARRKLRVEVSGGGEGNKGGMAKLGGIGRRARVEEKRSEPKAGKARIALCETGSRGRKGEEGRCGLV